MFSIFWDEYKLKYVDSIERLEQVNVVLHAKAEPNHPQAIAFHNRLCGQATLVPSRHARVWQPIVALKWPEKRRTIDLMGGTQVFRKAQHGDARPERFCALVPEMQLERENTHAYRPRTCLSVFELD